MGGRIESGTRIGQWVADKLGTLYSPEGSAAIGLVKNDKIVAGVIYENWNRKSIMTHIAIEGRLTRSFISAIFHHAFVTCGVNKIISPVNDTNTKSASLVENMGFVAEGRLKDCSPDGDIILYTLKKSDCRFLGERYGQRDTASPSAH
jgi:RimJ/RimL family protein N-acetyltransferase